MDIKKTLEQRGKAYGSYQSHAAISQRLKDVMRSCPNWDALAPDQKETLEMNAHKTARILNGNPNFHDSWHDIEGYTRLVSNRLLNEGTLNHAPIEEKGSKREVPVRKNKKRSG